MKDFTLVRGAFFCCTGNGKTRTVSGSVMDDKNNPVANASVMAKGTKQGTTTNEAGNFTLTVSQSVSTFGYNFCKLRDNGS